MFRLGVDPEQNRPAIYVLRLFGVRTILLGTELLSRNPEVRGRALRLAVRVHLRGKYKGKIFVVNAVGVYQVKGNVFSGVYTNGRGTMAAQLRLGLHAAEESAKNLLRPA